MGDSADATGNRQATLRGTLYSALQTLRGSPLGRYLRDLEEAERLAPAEFQRLCRARLKQTLEYAYAHVPLYQSGDWAQALSADRAGSVEHWPLLDSAELRSSFTALKARPQPRRTGLQRTSGSTGAPLTVVTTPEAEARSWAHRYRGLLWHGIPLGAPALRLSHRQRVLRDMVKGETCVPPIDSPLSLERALRTLDRKQPTFAMGAPSALFQFARLLREQGIPRPLLPFARVGGEQLYGFQRAELELHLCGRAIDSYGCTEIGALAGECPAGSLHVYADHVHVEIFDGDVPAGPGVEGEIVATTLFNKAMPLVRYRVGDRGRLASRPCRCGLPHPVLKDLKSRSEDTLSLADGRTYHASQVVEQLGSLFADPAADPVRQIQLTQFDVLDWEALLEVAPSLLDSNGGAPLQVPLERHVTAVLRRTLGEACRIACRFTPAITRVNGKLRYVHRADRRT